MGGEHLDDLALDQRRVDVHHDQAHAATQQVGGLDGDVDALVGRLPGQDVAQLLGVDPRDVQVDRRDRVARHPLDAVDVGAGVGDPAGDGGHRRGLQRRAEHGDVAATLGTAAVVAGAALELEGHAEVGGDALHRRRAAASSRGAS